MSVENARNFIDQAYKDKKLAQEGARRYKDIVDVGREHGYHFSKDDFEKAIRERQKPGKHGDPAVDPDTCFCCI